MDIKRLQQLAGILKEDINPYEDPKEIELSDKEIYDVAYPELKRRFEENEWKSNVLRKRTIDDFILSVEVKLEEYIEKKYPNLEDGEAEEFLNDINYNYTGEGMRMVRISKKIINDIKDKYLPKPPKPGVFNPFEEDPNLTDEEIVDAISNKVKIKDGEFIDIAEWIIKDSLDTALTNKYPDITDDGFDYWYIENEKRISASIQKAKEKAKDLEEERLKKVEEKEKELQKIISSIKISDKELSDILYKVEENINKRIEQGDLPEEDIPMSRGFGVAREIGSIINGKLNTSHSDGLIGLKWNRANKERIGAFRDKMRSSK